MAAIDAMPAGAVPVWAGNDIRGVCCFGDLLGAAMLATIASRIAGWSKTESEARNEIRNGLPLIVALEKYGHL